MIVLVFGYRAYPRLDLVERFVDSLPKGTMVISGWNGDISEKNDVDKTAILRARARELQTKTFPAYWTLDGRAAGPLRNSRMVKYLLERRNLVGDLVTAVGFDHALSKGTKDTIKKTLDAGILSLVLDEHGKTTYTTGFWEARKHESL